MLRLHLNGRKYLMHAACLNLTRNLDSIGSFRQEPHVYFLKSARPQCHVLVKTDFQFTLRQSISHQICYLTSDSQWCCIPWKIMKEHSSMKFSCRHHDCDVLGEQIPPARHICGNSLESGTGGHFV